MTGLIRSAAYDWKIKPTDTIEPSALQSMRIDLSNWLSKHLPLQQQATAIALSNAQ